MSHTRSDSMWLMLCDIRDYLKEDVTSQLKTLENRQISFNEWMHREWVTIKKGANLPLNETDNENRFKDFHGRINMLEKANIKRIDDINALDVRIRNIIGTISEMQYAIDRIERRQNRGFFARLFNLEPK